MQDEIVCKYAQFMYNACAQKENCALQSCIVVTRGQYGTDFVLVQIVFCTKFIQFIQSKIDKGNLIEMQEFAVHRHAELI